MTNDDPLSQAAASVPTSAAVPYDDLDPMPFGKHKDVPLQDVPATYLHYLWTNRPISDPRLEAYIKKSLNALKMENRNLIW